jgi:hypothetical protein
MAGDGKTEKLGGDEVSEIRCLLYDYDSGSANVKSAHMTYMKTKILPVLSKGGSLTIIGMASRCGNEATNSSLSSTRARQALAYVTQIAPKNVKSKMYEAAVAGAGTTVAKNQLQPAGSDNERYRSVYMSVWNKSDPPPPPTPDVKLPDGSQVFQGVKPVTPLPSDSALDKTGKALDIVSGAAGLAELAAGILGLGAAATAIGAVSAITGIISAIISTPMAWASQDAVARFNGRCQGFWEAMQDMAKQYKDEGLDKKALDSWPALAVPAAHIDTSRPVASLLVAEKCWREGQETGKTEAYNAIIKLDSTPLPAKALIAGKEYPVNARIALRSLWKWKGSDLGDTVKAEFNKRLKAAGKSEWPCRG